MRGASLSRFSALCRGLPGLAAKFFLLCPKSTSKAKRDSATRRESPGIARDKIMSERRCTPHPGSCSCLSSPAPAGLDPREAECFVKRSHKKSINKNSAKSGGSPAGAERTLVASHRICRFRLGPRRARAGISDPGVVPPGLASSMETQGQKRNAEGSFCGQARPQSRSKSGTSHASPCL